jgi:hypothetical protein
MSLHSRIRRWGLALAALLAAAALVGQAGAQPDSRYYTYDEVLALFDTWAAQYPSIFHREVIGYTLIGHEPIWAAKISDNPTVHEAEPRILIHAAQHANEMNGIGAVVFMMNRMLSRYGQQSYYTNMVDNVEWWFVPVLNIDGHRLCWDGVLHWASWRKTQRDNDGNCLYTYPADGVDPNRNWDFKWADYDSSQIWSTRYKGPYPFSEPEVVAIRDFTLREVPVFVMDLHSPDVPTDGNKIWWAWYDPVLYHNGPDEPIYRPICQALAARCQTETNGTYYNGSVSSYNNLPKEQCWTYANTGADIYVMEISRQYWWTGATIDTIAARVGRGLFYLGERAQAGPGLTGFVTDVLTGVPLVADIVVSQVHDPEIGPRLSDAFNGRYWRLLNAGSYTVTATAEHHNPLTRSIYVSATGWTRLDFQLTPDASLVQADEIDPPRLLWTDAPLLPGRAVHYRVERQGAVALKLLDLNGRCVRTLVDEPLAPGVRSVSLGGGLPAGGYLLLLRTDDAQAARKVIVVD